MNSFTAILAAGELESIHAVIGDVSIEAAAGEKKPATFQANAYSGGLLLVEKYDLPVVVDLAGLTFADQIRANLDHDDTKRVGHVVDPKNDGRTLTLSGVISAAGPAAKEVANSPDYPWTASIEVLPSENLEKIAAGQSVSVNGQTFTGPIYVARKSTLYGVALLANGADQSTSVRIAAQAADSKQIEETDMEFADWIKAAGFEMGTLNEKQKGHLQNLYDAEIKAVAAAGSGGGKLQPIIPENKFDLDGLKAAYAQHEAVIEAKLFESTGKVESHKLAEIKAAHAKKAIELKTDALQKEWSPLQFEVAAVKAASELAVALIQAERPAGPAIHASSKDASNEVIEAAMCMNLGLDVEKEYKEETLDSAHRHFRRIGLQEVMIMAAQANGYTGRSRISVDNLREVLGYAMPVSPIHAAGFSTVSLPGILTNVANKELLAGFMEEDQSWREIAAIKSVSDFKTVTSYRLLDEMEYEELGPNGEIAHGKLGEETFTRSADTYAKMFALTRQMIINDDLGAFDDLRTRLGRGGSRKFRKLFWTTFLNNGTFFKAARGNYLDGATSTLLTDGVGLQLGITKYRKMKSGDKKQVGVGPIGAPSTLLVPPELEHVADKLFVSGNLSATQDDNIHRNKYKPVVVNELSDSDFTGFSVKVWYLFGSTLKPVVVSFLNGIENPTIESADRDSNYLLKCNSGIGEEKCSKSSRTTRRWVGRKHYTSLA